jgi:hypothetical protein
MGSKMSCFRNEGKDILIVVKYVLYVDRRRGEGLVLGLLSHSNRSSKPSGP